MHCNEASIIANLLLGVTKLIVQLYIKSSLNCFRIKSNSDLIILKKFNRLAFRGPSNPICPGFRFERSKPFYSDLVPGTARYIQVQPDTIMYMLHATYISDAMFSSDRSSCSDDVPLEVYGM